MAKANSAIRDHLREASVVQSRLVAISLLIGILAIILIARLSYLQVYQYQKFAQLSDDNRVSTHPVAPVRGLIFDRNNRPLAANERAYDLKILPEKVQDMDALLASIGALIELSEQDIERFKKLVKVRPRFQPQILRANLTETEAARYSAKQHLLAGSSLVASLRRYYPEGALMGHALGYVARISPSDLKKVDKKAYAGTEYFGKLGIEKQYEDILLGEVGSEDVEINAHGKKVKTLRRRLPKTGQTLYLSLDTQLQRVATDILNDVEGAAVAIDPKNGEILAFVSAPNYDTNPFVNGIGNKAYKVLRESEREPTFNRAYRGRYAPGSTIKGFMGLMAIRSGIDPKEKIFAPGWFSLPNSKRRFRCWKRAGHGHVDLQDSLEQSCDVYFYRVANRLGIDTISKEMKGFGFGVGTGVDLPYTRQSAGLMPSRAWKKAKKGKSWYPGDTVNLGIGQGYMLTTPLQLASFTALLANRGRPVTPHFLTAVQNPQNGDYKQVDYPQLPKPEGYTDAAYAEVIEGMRNVVHGSRGTARRIGKGLPYEIAGKSGTSQVRSIPQGQKYDKENTPKKYRDNALFIAFAPLENPRIAVAVVVENGGGGSSVAAPIAKRIIDFYLVDRLGLYPREPKPEPEKEAVH